MSRLAPRQESLAQRFAEGVTAWLERRYRAVLLVALGLTLLATLAFLRLRIDVDLVSMLPQGHPAFADYQELVERFGATDVAVALVRAPDRRSALRFADAFAEELARAPEIAAVRNRVDLALFQKALLGGALPRLLPLEQHPELARRLAPAAIDRAVQTLRGILALPGAAGRAEMLAADPLGIGTLLTEILAEARPDAALSPGQEYLLAPDGKRLILLIRPAASSFDLVAMERLARALDTAENEARRRSGETAVEVAYTGVFAHAREDAALVQRDILLYTVLAFTAVLGTFLIGYRDLRILPLVSGQILAVSLIAFAIGVLVSGRLNAVSLAFAAIFYGLSIDAVIHFYTRFLEERATGAAVPRAIAQTISRTLAPVTIAALTTALAFSVIGLSELKGVAQLGFLTGLGMLLNVPATMIVLPAVLLWMARHLGSFRIVPALPGAHRLAALSAFSVQHRRAVRLVAIGLAAAAAILAGQARIDPNLFHLRSSDTRAAAVDAELAREFGFADPHGAVLVIAQEESSSAREAVLQANEAVAAALSRYRESGEIATLSSVAALLPSRATQERRLRAWADLPRAAAARHLKRRLTESGFRAEAFAGFLSLLREVPDATDATAAPLPGLELVFDRYLNDRSGRLAVLSTFTPRDVETLESIAASLPQEIEIPANVTLRVTGRPRMERALHQTITQELFGFTVAVLLGSGAILISSVWRPSVVAALLAIPAGSVLALVALATLLGWTFNPVNLIVLPLLVGIGVDNGLFLRERSCETGDPVEAMRRSGRAFAIVTATTVAGFGALSISRYPALSGLGQMAALGLSICFIATVLLLPALLPGRSPEERSAEHESR